MLANLGEYKDAELKREYMSDIIRLRDKVFSSLEPMQVGGVAINGKDFALNIERWVLYGHIRIDEDEEVKTLTPNNPEELYLQQYFANCNQMEWVHNKFFTSNICHYYTL